MRHLLIPALAAALLAPAARAQDDAKAVVEKAIKAHGGAANLDKFKAGRIKSKGVVSVAGMEIAVVGTSVFQLPGQSKSVLELEFMGNKVPVVQLVNGDRVSMTVNGMKREDLGEAQLTEAKMAIYLQSIYQLTPLLDPAKFTIKALGESKFQDKPVVGVSVIDKDKKFKEVKLFFDKESGLLVRAERMSLDGVTMAEVPAEMVFSDYKEYGGVKRPAKTVIFQDGKKFLESEVVEFTPLDKVDAKEFELDS
jgi:hypothetical protein